jgi:hypothetical protein
MIFLALVVESPAALRGRVECFVGATYKALFAMTMDGFSFAHPSFSGLKTHFYNRERGRKVGREEIARFFPDLLFDAAVEAVEKGGAEAVWIGTYDPNAQPANAAAVDGESAAHCDVS